MSDRNHLKSPVTETGMADDRHVRFVNIVPSCQSRDDKLSPFGHSHGHIFAMGDARYFTFSNIREYP